MKAEIELNIYIYMVVVLVTQLCLTLYEPTDCSPPVSSVHGIPQAGILEWVAISFSRGFSWLGNQTGIPYTAGRFFTVWATWEAHIYTHTHTHTYIYIYIYTHTHTHIYIYICIQSTKTSILLLVQILSTVLIFWHSYGSFMGNGPSHGIFEQRY